MRISVIVAAMALALSSTPASALTAKFVVENTLDYTIYAGCSYDQSVAISSGSTSSIFNCFFGILIREQPYGGSVRHHHSCFPQSTPVHRIRVTEGSGGTGMAFSHSCES